MRALDIGLLVRHMRNDVRTDDLVKGSVQLRIDEVCSNQTETRIFLRAVLDRRAGQVPSLTSPREVNGAQSHPVPQPNSRTRSNLAYVRLAAALVTTALVAW